jgi:putative sterol carrier protein
MPVFQSPEQAHAVFTRLFTILLKDDQFVDRMRAGGLSVHLVQSKPDVELYVTPDQVVDGAPPAPAAVRISMSCDTAHSLWQGKLLMPVALATGRVRIKGNVAKVLELVPILRPAFDRYPEIVAEHGISVG